MILAGLETYAFVMYTSVFWRVGQQAFLMFEVSPSRLQDTSCKLNSQIGQLSYEKESYSW